MRMKELLLLLIGVIFGTGGLWSWQQIRFEKERIELEKMKAATEIREKQNDMLVKSIELSKRYLETHFVKIGENLYTSPPSNKIDPEGERIKRQLDSLTDNYKALESQLAKLENREPHQVNLYSLPPSIPSGLSIQ